MRAPKPPTPRPPAPRPPAPNSAATISAVPRIPPALGAVLRPLPLLPLQPLLAALARRLRDRHPGLFERLGVHAAKRFGLAPTDLPFAFVLEPRPAHPSVTAVRRLPPGLDVRVAGPLAALLGMVDGSLDGDALFFSRDLEVAGDMEALLALRNAVDDAGIDLPGTALSLLGPLAGPAGQALQHGIARLRPRRRSAPGAAAWS